MSDPNIWRPGNTIDADNTIAHQSFTATAGQSLFTLTDFVYSPDTSTLMVAVAGLEQRPGIDFTETSFDSFTLTTPVQAGTVVFARAVTKLTAAKLLPGQVSNSYLADMAAGTIKGRAAGSGTGAPSDLSAAQVKTILSLSNVTNNAQTNAAVVPNTAPSSGQILVGNSGGSYTPKTVGGHATIDLNGNVTLANSGVAPGTYTKVIVDNKGRVTSGGFLAAGDVPTLNQNTTGNAGTATALQNSRNINGVPFNGTADITINAVDSTPRVPTSAVDTDPTLNSDSDSKIPSQKAIKAYVDSTAGVTSFASLTDVDTSGVANGDVFAWDSGASELKPANPTAIVYAGRSSLGTAAMADLGISSGEIRTNTQNDAVYMQGTANLSELTNAATARTNLGLGTSATLDVDTDNTLSADSDSVVPSQKAVKYYVDNMSPVQSAVTIIGNLDASNDPNYPPAATGDAYSVTVAGKVGGASGVTVGAGDLVVAKVANAGGDQATVGTDWTVLGASSAGALQAALNLSDLPSPSTARANLGLGDSSTLNVGTTASTVAAGDDSRILNGATAYGWGDHSAAGYAKTKADVGLSSVTDDAQVKAADLATEQEAKAGVDNTKWMTPLRTKQLIDEIGTEGTDVLSTGESAGKVLTADGLGGSSWQTAGSGSGTVTSVGLSVPTGLSVSGSPVTSSGTLAISLAANYKIPTTTEVTNGSTAYSWGNHASAGYAKTKSDVGLSNVTNDAQTKASVVPNTAPTAGQILIGNFAEYVPRTVSGAITLGAAGIATLNSQVVTNDKLANMAGGTMKCRFPGSATGEPADHAIGGVIAAANFYATAKSTPHDNDLFGLSDSQDSWSLKKLTWAQLKAAVGSANPSVTGTVTLSNAPNTVALTNIVTDLGLEFGDVIDISGVGLRRIDSIPNNNSVVVNAAHSTNQSNGPLALPSNTMSRTITLVSKWYNAARGLGQAFVERSGQRAIGVSSNWGSNYQGAPGNVPTDIIIGAVLTSGTSWLEVEIGGIAGIATSAMAGTANSKATLSFTVPPGAFFRLRTNSVSYSDLVWMEYR